MYVNQESKECLNRPPAPGCLCLLLPPGAQLSIVRTWECKVPGPEGTGSDSGLCVVYLYSSAWACILLWLPHYIRLPPFLVISLSLSLSLALLCFFYAYSFTFTFPLKQPFLVVIPALKPYPLLALLCPTFSDRMAHHPASWYHFYWTSPHSTWCHYWLDWTTTLPDSYCQCRGSGRVSQVHSHLG